MGWQVSEPEGFRDFVAARSAALMRSAWLLTGDEATAQDLVQAALVKTWARWARLARQDAPEAYVRRVMLSTLLTWSRRRWRGEFPAASVPDRPELRDAAAEADVRRAVSEALRTLPPPATGGGGLAVLRRPDRSAGRGGPRLLGRHREEPDVEGAVAAAWLPAVAWSIRGGGGGGGQP